MVFCCARSHLTSLLTIVLTHFSYLSIVFFILIVRLNYEILSWLCIFFFFQFLDIGIVTSIECNHKQVESARKGQEVCIKIDPIPGESPKMYGRHFDENDMLTSKVSAQRNYMLSLFIIFHYVISFEFNLE